MHSPLAIKLVAFGKFALPLIYLRTRATLDRGGVASLITVHVAGRVESKKSVCMDIEDILPNSKSRGTLGNSVWVYINCLINITADAAFGIVSARTV